MQPSNGDGHYDYLTKRQSDYQPTQVLPYWLSASTTTIPNPTFGGTAIVTVAIVDLPLTYYGPSIPLGTNWVYGGSASPASIYVPPETPTDIPTTTEGPTTTGFPSTIPFTTAIPTPSLTSSIPAATSSLASLSSQSVASVSSQASVSTASSSLSILSQGISASSSASVTPTSSASSAAAVIPAPTPPSSGSDTSFPTGAIVGTVIGAILVLIGLFILCCLCVRRRRRGSIPTRHSTHDDPETELGYAEGSSLLSGRLAGGESPPPHSPALSTATLGPAVRSRTPLSTRRFPYVPVGSTAAAAGMVGSREGLATTAPWEQRASSNMMQTTEAAYQNVGREMGGAPPTITINTSTTSSRRLSQRISPTKIGATAYGLLGFLGLRRSGRSSYSLGSGWEPVTPPAGGDPVRRGSGPSSAAALGVAGLERNPSSRSNLAGGSSQQHPGIQRLESTTYASGAKSRSTVSGLSNYWDAPSRPDSPPAIPAIPPTASTAAGLGAAAAAGAMAAREMSQKDSGLVSQRSTPMLRPGPPPQPSPLSSNIGSPPMTSNPFENQAYQYQPSQTQSQRTTRDPFDDVLDSPVPLGLLPPGLEQDRGQWSRENISSPILEDDEEDDIGGTHHQRDALLDDAPPAPVGSLGSNAGGSALTGVVSGGLAAAGISQLGRLRAQENRNSGAASGTTPSAVNTLRREESPLSVRTMDSIGDTRPWSGQVGQARRVHVAGVASAQSSGNNTAQLQSPGRDTFEQQQQQTATSRPPPAVPGPRDWTTDLSIGEITQDMIPENLRSIYEWFRRNPSADHLSTVIPASSVAGGSAAGGSFGGLRLVTQPPRQSTASGGAEVGESSESEYSSLLRTLRSFDRGGGSGSGSGSGANNNNGQGAGPSSPSSPPGM
ncbi:hypothetical protein FRB94_006383 [Tulasnella sp. JGI-2019a]|nr:hypothetical protein FRB94_006383 [Tulasnella sp. JGI-2019a]KAG9005077.1 hypothetical protein FRB93_009946 [Tulasnella sp. JGI-2019a]